LLASGFTANVTLQKNPRLRDLYELYLMGRSATLTIYEKPVDREGTKKVVPVIWPQHIQTWPRPGGLLDQDYLESRVFTAFLRGDIAGTQEYMKKVRKF
jgi:hypothetical protein